MTTVIIFGANGMLGRYVKSYFLTLKPEYNVIAVTRNDVDASKVSFEELMYFLTPYHSAWVINCVGKIPQRGDDSFRDYVRVNSIFPHLLSAACAVTSNQMIHITTDCVFSGADGGYTEDDSHDETNFYGTSKSLGEPTDCCTIRTSIIGEELDNKKSLLEWVRSNDGGEINGYINHKWNGITCLQLANFIGKMIKYHVYWKGVRHIFSPKALSKHNLIKIIVEVYGLNITVNPIETDNIDKTLRSKYRNPFAIPDIRKQIASLKEFSPNLI
jgi:dTDP-4-dehydrorhamnose reductase